MSAAGDCGAALSDHGTKDPWRSSQHIYFRDLARSQRIYFWDRPTSQHIPRGHSNALQSRAWWRQSLIPSMRPSSRTSSSDDVPPRAPARSCARAPSAPLLGQLGCVPLFARNGCTQHNGCTHKLFRTPVCIAGSGDSCECGSTKCTHQRSNSCFG